VHYSTVWLPVVPTVWRQILLVPEYQKLGGPVPVLHMVVAPVLSFSVRNFLKPVYTIQPLVKPVVKPA